MSWSIINLKNTITEMFGKDQINLVEPSLESIFENQDFSRFHYSELQRLITSHVDGKNSSEDYFKLVMTNDNDVKNDEYEFKIACKANIMAFVRSLHSNADLLAHTIYYSLGLNLSKETELNPRQINIFNIKTKLEKMQGTCSLINELNNLTDHKDFKYLNSLVNHSKHRANISSNLTYQLKNTGKSIYQFFFQKFEYDKINYEEQSTDSFLNREYDRQSEAVIVIGNTINECVEHANKNLKSEQKQRAMFRSSTKF